MLESGLEQQKDDLFKLLYVRFKKRMIRNLKSIPSTSWGVPYLCSFNPEKNLYMCTTF